MSKAIVLVYQAGIANVFEVSSLTVLAERKANLLFQGGFESAKLYAMVAATYGQTVRTAYCNQAGDIANLPWIDTRDDAPFCDMTFPVVCN